VDQPPPFSDEHRAALADLNLLRPTKRNDQLVGWQHDGWGPSKFTVDRAGARRYAEALLAWAATEPRSG
jgi:hypothetical protein